MATITGLATSDPDLSILVDVLVYLDTELGTDLVATLDDPDQTLTLFAPSNAAFGDLAVDAGFAGDPSDTGAVTAYLVANVPAEILLDIVQYHVAPGELTSGDVAASDSIDTLNGETISPDLPTLVDNEPDLVDPSLVELDIEADNGVVHTIDKVLLPFDVPGNDAPTITEIVASSGDGFDDNNADFDILLTALNTADLAETLDDTALDATVFAPTDAAFVGLANGLGYGESDEEGAWNYLVESLALLNGGDAVSLLSDVLLYHVAGESLQASQVLASDEIDTLQGGTIAVNGTMLEDGEPDIADPNIIDTDIQASNGVVHVIDGVLLPVDLLPSTGANQVDFVIGDNNGSFVQLGRDNDYVDGNGGRDVVLGGRDADVIFGGDDGDALFGNSGADHVDGGHGDDFVSGGAGADWVGGGSHDDMVNGGAGHDTISGGSGDDTLEGGKGQDVFVFVQGDETDVIVDFKVGTDRIDLSAYDIDNFHDIEDAIDEDDGNTDIHLGSGDAIILIDINGHDLSDGDFIF